MFSARDIIFSQSGRPSKRNTQSWGGFMWQSRKKIDAGEVSLVCESWKHEVHEKLCQLFSQTNESNPFQSKNCHTAPGVLIFIAKAPWSDVEHKAKKKKKKSQHSDPTYLNCTCALRLHFCAACFFKAAFMSCRLYMWLCAVGFLCTRQIGPWDNKTVIIKTIYFNIFVASFKCQQGLQSGFKVCESHKILQTHC